MGEGEAGGHSQSKNTKECLSCLALNLMDAKKCQKCGAKFLGVLEGPSALEVGETFTYTGDRPFKGRIQVVALGFPMSRYTRLNFLCQKGKGSEECEECDITRLSIGFEDDKSFDPSAFASYFDSNHPVDALRVLVERGLKPRCGAWLRIAVAEGENERAVTQAIVMDRMGVEGRAWFVHGSRCDLKRAPNWVVADGWLCKGQRGRIGVLVQAFQAESEVTMPSPKALEPAELYLKAQNNPNGNGLEDCVIWRIAEALKRRSQLKGEEVVKGYVSDLLTIASPVWVKTPEGEPQLGATTCEMGPTTTAKSQRARELIKWLGAGKYDTGKKTAAGLTAGAEKVEGIGWIVRKGLLPSMDLSFLIVDNMPPHGLDEQIESRRNGVCIVTTIKQAEMWARCRMKLLSNPLTAFDETMHKCTALRMFDSKLVARFTFAVFTYGVSTEERYDAALMEITKEEEELLDAARIVLLWNLSTETTFKVPPELWPKIMEYGRVLEEAYGNEDIPLLLRANPYKLSVLTYAFALLEGERYPSERHVRLAYLWLDQCAKDIELDEYTVQWKKQHELSEEEYATIKGRVEEEIAADLEAHGGGPEDTYTYRMVEFLAKRGRGQRDEVAAYADIEPQTVSVKARLLKGLELLRSDMDGYRFTAKGVRFFKRWFLERGPITKITQITTFEGHTPSGKTKIGETSMGVTPETGNLSNLSNRLKGQDLIDKLHLEWAKITKGTQEDFYALAEEHGGYTKDQARALFDRLVNQGCLAMDPEGYWRWI